MCMLATIASPSPLLPVIFEDKRTGALKHIARSERLVAVRPASRLEAHPRPEMISTGIVELDTLTGGIPRGCLTEVCGAPSSGKTSVLLATIAAATQRGESCVLIDASDSFDPSSGSAAGMDFSKLLWVRCGNLASSYVVGRTSWAEKPLYVVRRTSYAKSKTPPFDNLRAGSSAKNAEGWGTPAEDESFDFANDGRRTTYDAPDPTADNWKQPRRTHEARLEQVLKSTDLILQSGGFGLVALDLAGIPDKFVHRIPLASWFRFQRTVEHTKTALLVVSENPCAQTCATLVMKVQSKPSAIRHQPSEKPCHAELLKEIQIEAEMVRLRLERKPMQPVKTHFRTHAVRAG